MARLDLSDALAWAEARLGARPTRVADVSWAHAGSSVARLERADGAVAYLKRHASAGHHAREVAALEGWARALPGTPALLAVAPPPRAWVLLGAVPGTLVASWSADDPRQGAAHEAAGAWLARLHALPFADDDPLPLADALLRRLDAWRDRSATGLLPAATWTSLGAALVALPRDGWRRVRAHRDFSPRNWLWDEAAGLGVIDFEHARPDAEGTDVARLADGAWLGRPDLEAAFWRGYGSAPDAATHDRWRLVRGVQAATTVAWARAHGDEAFEAAGRAALERLGWPT